MMTLKGKKTYITAVVLALGSFAMAMGWLSQEQYQVIVGLLASLGLAALRSGVAKSATDKTKTEEAD
jgi:predicted phage tail protein